MAPQPTNNSSGIIVPLPGRNMSLLISSTFTFEEALARWFAFRDNFICDRLRDYILAYREDQDVDFRWITGHDSTEYVGHLLELFAGAEGNFSFQRLILSYDENPDDYDPYDIDRGSAERFQFWHDFHNMEYVDPNNLNEFFQQPLTPIVYPPHWNNLEHWSEPQYNTDNWVWQEPIAAE